MKPSLFCRMALFFKEEPVWIGSDLCQIRSEGILELQASADHQGLSCWAAKLAYLRNGTWTPQGSYYPDEQLETYYFLLYIGACDENSQSYNLCVFTTYADTRMNYDDEPAGWSPWKWPKPFVDFTPAFINKRTKRSASESERQAFFNSLVGDWYAISLVSDWFRRSLAADGTYTIFYDSGVVSSHTVTLEVMDTLFGVDGSDEHYWLVAVTWPPNLLVGHSGRMFGLMHVDTNGFLWESRYFEYGHPASIPILKATKSLPTTLPPPTTGTATSTVTATFSTYTNPTTSRAPWSVGEVVTTGRVANVAQHAATRSLICVCIACLRVGTL